MNFAAYVDRASRNAPRSLAIDGPTQSLTFEELAKRSDHIAHALDSCGIGTDDHVAIGLPNGTAFVTTYLGILKHGAVAVPVNTRFTQQQIQYVLRDSDATCIVTNNRSPDLEISGLETYRYADLCDEDGKGETIPRRSDEMAELLYTSGTTGAPKGVYHTHGNLVANAMGYIEYNEWDRNDVSLTVCPCFHVTGLNITTTPFIALEAENHLLKSWDLEDCVSCNRRTRRHLCFLDSDDGGRATGLHEARGVRHLQSRDRRRWWLANAERTGQRLRTSTRVYARRRLWND